MKQLGITKKNERVYQLSNKYGVEESGMVVEINNENDTFVFTKYYIDMDIQRNSSIEEMRNKIVDLRKVKIDNYTLNLLDFSLDEVPYIQWIKGVPEDEENEVLKRVKQIPLKHQFFAKNQEAIVFIYLDGNSAIIKKNYKFKFQKDNDEEGNKKLVSILKSISCQFEVYEDIEELKKKGEINF